MTLHHCAECGRSVAGGVATCQRDFEELHAREMSEPSTYAVHRLIVDAYALQHPERYCKSARSYAAHQTGMLVAMEHASHAEPPRALQRWLSARPALEKPPLPERRGERTIAEVLAAPDRLALDRGVREWARAAWAAYAPWHELARRWLAEAYAPVRR